MFGVARLVVRSMAAVGGIAPVFGLGALCVLAASAPAAAQFSFFGQGDASQEAYDTIASHGFHLLRPLMQNNDVYIADVIDRRQRRERLIISRSDGRILQRFLIDGAGAGPYARAPLRQPNAQPDFFSRLVRGFGDDSTPRPPADIDVPDREDAVEPQAPERTVRPARIRPSDVEPRIATRRDDAPIASRPLTPEPAPYVSSPTSRTALPIPAARSVPIEKPQVAVPAIPAPQASPPPTRATVVSTDPLRIPGMKEKEAAKPSGTAAAKPAAPPKPAPSGDVPVAPLD